MNNRKISVYDIIFLLAALIIFVCAVFLPPVRSIADQGDFERVMRPCGLDFPADYSFYGYAVRFFELKFTKADLLLYLPRLLFIVPTSAFIFPTSLARLICLPLGVFDVRILAVIMFVWYTLVCMMILRRVKIKNPIMRLLFISFFMIVLYNGVNLTIFNSLYGQSVMLASFATLILAALRLFENTEKKSAFIFFTAASCLLINSKLQCAVFAPFLAAMLIYTGIKSNKRRMAVICAAIIMWNGIGGYIINGGALNMDTQYNSVFYGILKNSPDSAADLRSMGIDEDMAADSGKHAYLDPSEYSVAPRSDEAMEKFHSKMNNGKLIRFYITHPKRFLSAMEITAQNAFMNKINLGTFEKKYGFDEGKSSYRFDLWENVRNHLPKTLAFIIPVWIIFIALGIVMIKKKSPYGLPLLMIFLMGAVQFPMPYIGNGEADISKQLFMFNIIFDFGITVLFYIFLRKIEIFSKKVLDIS